jgi:hypothetical protein
VKTGWTDTLSISYARKTNTSSAVSERLKHLEGHREKCLLQTCLRPFVKNGLIGTPSILLEKDGFTTLAQPKQRGPSEYNVEHTGLGLAHV